MSTPPIIPHHVHNPKSKAGGVRPGAGRPKGTKEQHTLARDAARVLLESKVIAAHEPLILAQLSIAIGQQFLFKIEKQLLIGPKGGKTYKPLPPKMVTDPKEIELYLLGLVVNGDMYKETDPAATYYYITTKEPNNMAIDSLFNRLHGRPKETLDLNANVQFSLKALATKRLQKAQETLDEQQEQELLDAAQQETPQVIIDANAREIVEVVSAPTV